MSEKRLGGGGSRQRPALLLNEGKAARVLERGHFPLSNLLATELHDGGSAAVDRVLRAVPRLLEESSVVVEVSLDRRKMYQL